MARNGYRIFDSDTHVGPDARILAGYLSAAERDRLRSWEAYKSTDRHGRETYTKGQRRYRRRLGMATPDEAPSGYMAGFTGVKRMRDPSPDVDADAGERIKDMDHEGVDLNLMLPSGWFGTWTAGDDVALEMAMYRAYHRWMEDYCGAYPSRLGGVILAGARESRVRSPRSVAAAGRAGVGDDGLCTGRHAPRPPSAGAALRRGRRVRSRGRASHLHSDAAICARRPGHVGQSRSNVQIAPPWPRCSAVARAPARCTARHGGGMRGIYRMSSRPRSSRDTFANSSEGVIART
jgi:hypothetical protein